MSKLFSQVIYCRGYSGEEPPLPIPNREVKLTIADGTAPPGGRVGSCGSLECQTSHDAWHSSLYLAANCLSHSVLYTIPRSKIERGMYYKSMKIRQLLAKVE